MQEQTEIFNYVFEVLFTIYCEISRHYLSMTKLYILDAFIKVFFRVQYIFVLVYIFNNIIIYS